MSRLLRVLVVEDVPDDAELMVLELSRGGFDPVWKRVDSAATMRAALGEGAWEVVLSDYRLPGFGALDALALTREIDSDLPFVVVSGTIGEEEAVAVMRAGATDYLLKKSLVRLPLVVERELREAEGRRARRKAERDAAYLAAIVQSSEDAIVSKTLDGIVTSWNPAAERLYGWSAREAIGRHLSFIFPPERINELAYILQRLRQGERISGFETVRLRKNGERIDVSVSVSSVRDGEGRLTGAAAIVRDITARKRAEAILARDALLLANVRDSIIVTDLEGIVTYWNEGATRLFGWPAVEMVGRPLVERVPPNARAALAVRIQAIAAGGEWSGEWEDYRKDGSRVWIDARTSLIRGQDNRPVGILGIAHDITDRKQAEARLRESEARFRALFECGMVPVAYWHVDGRITDANQPYLDLIGYTTEDVAAGLVRWDRLTPPEFLHLDQHAIREANDRGHCTPFEKEYIRKDGSRVPVVIAAAVMPGDADHGVGFAIDLTPLKRAEKDLRLRDRAIQAVTQGILITDPNQEDNPIIYASPGFERLSGYASSEVVGRNCRFLQGKDTDPQAVALLREAIQAVRPCTVELLNYKKDGTPFWNELSISPVQDETGRLTHFVAVQADVTQRRQLEEQYRQSQKMEAVGQLAGGVAHDFNNLLCIINGYSELLLQSLPPDNPMRGVLNEIRTAGERSASLTRQLLAFSRKQIVAPRILDLNGVVRDTEKMLRRVIGEDVRLTTTLAEGLGTVRADEGQMQQVLLNLAVNARDAMPRGGRLTIETHPADVDEHHVRSNPDVPAGRYILLVMTDTGCGMTEEVKARIFEPFFTTKGPGKGTGLGLAVVHGVVKQAGGHLEVHSEPGVGTTFKIYLPRADQQAKATTSLSGVKAPPRGTETILLVEDDDGVRSLSRHMLKDLGYTVLEASGGAEALRAAAQCRGTVHLVITDVVMPGMSGREVAQHVTKLHPKAKILFCSGYTDDAVVRHGVLQDQVYFLPKPFSPIALACKVREILGPQEHEPGQHPGPTEAGGLPARH